MKKKDITIIAINPGTRYLGVAVFQRSDLVYWGVKVFKGRWSRKKVVSIRTTFLSLIDQHGATVLVLKKLHHSRSSRNLSRLVESIRQMAKRRKLRVFQYSLGELKEFLALGARMNRMDIAGLAVARYQFLINQLRRERKHKHPYFIRMFEAIVAGILAFNRVSR